jgi:hypothetical protein
MMQAQVLSDFHPRYLNNTFTQLETDVPFHEEPGQARRMSRSGSVISANLGLNFYDFNLNKAGGSGGSQRSSLFPWDNAGPSSGSGNVADPDVNLPIESVNVRLRTESPSSRRESSLAPSQRGGVVGGLTFSPAIGKGGSQIMGDDFAFDGKLLQQPSYMSLNKFHLVDNLPEDGQQDTQQSDMNLITLERNSYNFLE